MLLLWEKIFGAIQNYHAGNVCQIICTYGRRMLQSIFKVGWVNLNLETIIAIIIWLLKDTTFAQAKIIIANTKGCIFIIFPFP